MCSLRIEIADYPFTVMKMIACTCRSGFGRHSGDDASGCICSRGGGGDGQAFGEGGGGHAFADGGEHAFAEFTERDLVRDSACRGKFSSGSVNKKPQIMQGTGFSSLPTKSTQWTMQSTNARNTTGDTIYETRLYLS
jgi:hypothetical protein